jgi:hypothetical protein
MNSMRNVCVVALLALLAGSAGLSAQSPQNADFSTASLVGSYAAQEHGDGSVSAGLGVVHYDGKGKTTRRITVNAPAEDGGRQILVFESEGQYTVNADGTGTVTYTNAISGGAVTTDTFDFVITEATPTWIPGRRPARIAAELFAVQRQAGVTVSLITSLQKRIAEQ